MTVTLTDVVGWSGEAPKLIDIGTIDANWRELLPSGSPTPVVCGVAQASSQIGFYIKYLSRELGEPGPAPLLSISYSGTWHYRVRDADGAILQEASYSFEGDWHIYQSVPNGAVTRTSSCNLVASNNGTAPTVGYNLPGGGTVSALKFEGAPSPLNDQLIRDDDPNSFGYGSPIGTYLSFFVRIDPMAFICQMPHGSTVESKWQITANKPLSRQQPGNYLTLRGPVYPSSGTNRTQFFDPFHIAAFRKCSNVYPGGAVADMEQTQLALFVRDGQNVYPYSVQGAGTLTAIHELRNRTSVAATLMTTEKWGANLVTTADLLPPQLESTVAIAEIARGNVDGFQALLAAENQVGNSLSQKRAGQYERRSDRAKWAKSFFPLLGKVERVTSGWATGTTDWRIVATPMPSEGDVAHWKLCKFTPRSFAVSFMANIWEDPNIAYCAACPLPGGGVAAVALYNKATINAATGAITLEKKWLFKRTFDEPNWPADADAVTIVDLMANAADERFARPITIYYAGGLLTVADGRNATYVSPNIGEDGSWKPLQ